MIENIEQQLVSGEVGNSKKPCSLPSACSVEDKDACKVLYGYEENIL